MRPMIRKQTQADFDARVRRLDPHYARTGRSRPSLAAETRADRPALAVLGGFTWIFVAVSISRNRETLRESLAAGTLNADMQWAVMAGLAAMLAATAVMLLVHALRFVARRKGKRGASGPLLIGAIAALALSHTPPSVVSAGIEMIDPNSRALLRTANKTVKDNMGVDLGSVRFVVRN